MYTADVIYSIFEDIVSVEEVRFRDREDLLNFLINKSIALKNSLDILVEIDQATIDQAGIYYRPGRHYDRGIISARPDFEGTHFFVEVVE